MSRGVSKYDGQLDILCFLLLLLQGRNVVQEHSSKSNIIDDFIHLSSCSSRLMIYFRFVF